MRARHEAPAALSPTTLADLLVMPTGAVTAAAAAAAAVDFGAAGHANRKVVSTVAPFPLESTELPGDVANQRPPEGTKAHACRLDALRAAAAASSFHPAEGDDAVCREESVVGSEAAIVMIPAAVCDSSCAFSSRYEPEGTLGLKHGGEPKRSCQERLSAGLLQGWRDISRERAAAEKKCRGFYTNSEAFCKTG